MRDASSKSIMTVEERLDLLFNIRYVFSSDGMVAGHRAWKAAAGQRLKHNDFATLDILYAEFVEKGIIKLGGEHELVQSLIQWHYKTDNHSARAAEILFPDLWHDSVSHVGLDHSAGHTLFFDADMLRSRRAIHFLQGIWERKADTSWLMLNFRRTIVAAKLRGVKLVEELFAAMIRCLASVGNMSAAQVIYDEMVFYHQIGASFLSRTLLLRGYARISDWSRVEHEIEASHNLGLSRSEPHGYALMVNAVLQEYAARSSIERFQNFVIFPLVPFQGRLFKLTCPSNVTTLSGNGWKRCSSSFPKSTPRPAHFNGCLGSFGKAHARVVRKSSKLSKQ
jgi:hypothetical protein